MAPDSIIDRYTNCEVEILYLTDGGQYRDRGKFTEFDGSWLMLEKPGNELFLVPVSAVRLIKVISRPRDPEAILLRPSAADDEAIDRSLTSKL